MKRGSTFSFAELAIFRDGDGHRDRFARARGDDVLRGGRRRLALSVCLSRIGASSPRYLAPSALNARPDTTFKKSAIESIAEPVCRAHGVELVDVQWTMDRGGPVLRVLIDRERADVQPGEPGSGVSIEDCQGVSRDLSTALDVHEKVVPGGRYRLEVSSPGLDRPLVKPRDFERFAGSEVKVQTRSPVPGTEDRKKVQGVLRGLDGDVVRIEEGSRTYEVPFGDIAKANVVFKFTQPKRSGAR